MNTNLLSLLAAMAISNNTAATVKGSVKAFSHSLNPLPGINDLLPRKHVNILTYNFFLRPPTVQDDQYDDYKDQRLEEFVKLLPEYDIICFEEVFGFMNMRKKNLIEYAKQSGFPYSTDSPGPSPQSGCLVDGGLVIVSRFPIIVSDFQAFPKGYHIDALAEKGVLYAKIEIKDDILHLFHTHQFTNYVGYVDSMIRRAEGFAVWRSFMQDCLKKYKYKENEVCLLLGDFNVDGKDPHTNVKELAKHPAVKLYPHLEKKDKLGEYDAMKSILSDDNNDELEDIFLKKYGKHPGTFASIYGGGGSRSLDYIFKLTPKNMLKHLEEQEVEKTEKEGNLRVIAESAEVQKFAVTGFPFKQLSDHYGLMVSLEYAQKSQNLDL